MVDTLDREGYIPIEVAVDKATLSPEDYLATVCSLLLLIADGKLPKRITVRKGNFTESRYVNKKALKKACDWIMLPEHFEAPRLLEQILLQTWTLKPAIGSN